MHSFASIFAYFELSFKARHLKFLTFNFLLKYTFLSKFMSYWYKFVSKSLFMAATPLVKKMAIYHHNDKLWGIYNLTGTF